MSYFTLIEAPTSKVKIFSGSPELLEREINDFINNHVRSLQHISTDVVSTRTEILIHTITLVYLPKD